MASRAMLSAACFAWILLHANASVGQTVATTGTITGRVTDASGAVLPGVAVAIASDALMGTRAALTDRNGDFRFPALPPGDYSVVFERDGFTGVRREAIHVSIAFTATVDAELELAPLRDDVTVVRGAAPIDRQSTAIAATLGSCVTITSVTPRVRRTCNNSSST